MQLPLTQRGIVVFIDPGKSGGIVAIDLLGRYVDHLAADHPDNGYVVGKRLSGAVVAAFLSRLQAHAPALPIVKVGIEKQSTRPKEGLRAALTTGRNWGVLVGVVEALGLPLVEVTPAKWAGAVHGKGAKTSAERKARSVQLCRQELPDLPLVWGRRVKPHDGLADAGAGALWLRSYVLHGG